ncbi:hypothetical protein H311_02525 [Anncaliia algerae PRA109]|nr:hypothetical protein H311_02525 [Anncaliia algerae PRA109]
MKKNTNHVYSQINYLYDISFIQPNNSKKYIKKIIDLSKKHQLRLSKEIKRSICRKCYSIMIINLNSSSRIEKLKEGTSLITICLACNNEKRIVFQGKGSETH